LTSNEFFHSQNASKNYFKATLLHLESRNKKNEKKRMKRNQKHKTQKNIRKITDIVKSVTILYQYYYLSWLSRDTRLDFSHRCRKTIKMIFSYISENKTPNVNMYRA